MSAEKRAQAIDLTHHISDLAKRRQVSPLKGLQKFILNKDTIVLAGGKYRRDAVDALLTSA